MTNPEHPDPDPTRRIDPPDEPTQSARPTPGASDAEPTRRLDTPAQERTAWEGEAHPRPAGGDVTQTYDQTYDEAGPPPDVPGRRRRHGFLWWLFGLVLGFVLAFLVVALATDDRPATDEAAQAQLEAMEAELEERDAQIAELEARLAEAEAAAGDRDADVEAQRQALDERAAALEEWQQALAEREAAIDEREAAVAEREREVEQREDEQPEQTEDSDGIELPDIDDEVVDNIVQRILDQLRDLFN